MIYISNELTHHGVKGMKWGVRKQRSHSLSSRPKTKKKIDQYSSAGYKNDNRSYSKTKQIKSTRSTAEKKAADYMKKHLGEKWATNPKNKDVYNLVVSEMYEEIESKGRYKSPYL